VVQPALASISEVFGRQPLVYLSLILFTFGSLLCAIAHNVTVLLIGRCIQGIGGGGIITMTQVIYADIVPLRLRPKYLAIVQAAWAIGMLWIGCQPKSRLIMAEGTMIGPVTGGVLCDRTTWRWIFILNFPFCGLGFICTFLFVRLKAVSQLTFSQKLQKTDWIGTILLTGGLVSLLIGLSWGGHPYAWSSARTISPIVVGIIAIIAFAFWQRHIAPTSLLPLSLFWCRSAVAAYYCALTHGLVVSDNLHPTEELGVRLLINKKVFVGMYYFPFYLMSILGANSTQAGVDQFPALVCVLPGSIIVAALITRLGRFRWAIWGGWAIITLGSGLFQLFGEHTTTAVWATVIAIRGIGTGMVLTSVNVGVQAISKSEDAPMAASMYGFFRSLGMPLGVAVSTILDF
jgi:MFS family permease